MRLVFGWLSVVVQPLRCLASCVNIPLLSKYIDVLTKKNWIVWKSVHWLVWKANVREMKGECT